MDEETKLRKIKTYYKKYGIPKRFKDAMLEDIPFVEKKIINKEIDPDKGEAFFITGIAGRGKTHLLVALLKYYYCNTDYSGYAEEKKSFLFVSAEDILVEIKNSYIDNSESESELLDHYSAIDYLFLDDFGIGKNSEWVASILCLLIDRRYRTMLPTFISSNLSLQNIAEIIDDRIASRISETSQVLSMNSTDWRQKKRTLNDNIQTQTARHKNRKADNNRDDSK